MTYYKNPNAKASETITLRLTVDEKKCLYLLAEAEKKSRTDLIRRLIFDAASQKGILDSMQSLKKPKEISSPKYRQEPLPPIVQIPVTELNNATSRIKTSLRSKPLPSTFGELAESFRHSFQDRAEGTRKELDDTLRFLAGVETEHKPIISVDTQIEDLTSEMLKKTRDTVSKMDIRVAKKNLHLTYLRMMLHFAHKQIKELPCNPTVDLPSFTISELPNAWPGKPA